MCVAWSVADPDERADMSESTTTCEVCGVEFPSVKVGAHTKRYCSSACRRKAWKADNPDRERYLKRQWAATHAPVRLCRCGAALPAGLHICIGCKVERANAKATAVLLRKCPDCGQAIGEPGKHRCQKCREQREGLATTRKRARKKRECRSQSHKCEVSRHTRWHVYERDQFKCHICGERVELHGDPNGDWAPCLDHVIAKARWPKGKRGVNHVDNLKTAHRVCNSHKNVHPDDDLPEHIVRRIIKRVEARCVA